MEYLMDISIQRIERRKKKQCLTSRIEIEAKRSNEERTLISYVNESI